jgi:hypothetical protein
MTQQLLIILISASIGFVSGIFFCIGNVLNSAKQIAAQGTPYFGFSVPLARSLAAQRAQYVVGALLLVVSFALQVAATIASPTTHVNLPRWIQPWPCFVLAVLVSTSLLAGVASVLLYKATMRKVLSIKRQK